MYLDTWERDKKLGKLSLMNKIKLRFMVGEDPSLISGLDATQMARMIDWSHWQGDIDLVKIKAEGDVAIGSPKCSDGKQVVTGDPYDYSNYVDDWFYRNVQKCYDTRMACMPFHYMQMGFPDYTNTSVVDVNWKALTKALYPLAPKKSYHAICLDVEEKNANNSNGSEVVLKLRDRIKNDAKLSQVPLVIYTSMSILNYYTVLREQISYKDYNQTLLWLAQWSYNTVTTTTWASMVADILAKLTMKVITPGFVDWWALQWTSSMILPGCAGRLDQNVLKKTKAQVYAQLGFDPGTVVVPPVDPPSTGEYATKEEVSRIRTTVDTIDAYLKSIPTYNR